MRELLDFLLKSIAPSAKWEIDEKKEDEVIEFSVKVDKENMGLVIGKGGNTVKAIQTLLRVRSAQENTKVYLNIVESS